MSVEIRIENIAEYVDQQVTIKGWLYASTRKGKLMFARLRDGSGMTQGVAYRPEIGDELFEELAKTDYNLAITAFYDSMNCFENSIASIVGSKLIEGFSKGYSSKEYKKLDIKIIKEQINQFIRIKEQIIKND